MKRVFIIILLAAVLMAGGYFVYTRIQRVNRASQSSVQTEALKKGSLVNSIGATGTVRTNQAATVSWPISGRVGQVMVKEGDAVTVNQLLAELAPSTYPQNIFSARADLITAQQNLDNLKNSDFSAAQALQKLAQAQKDLADAQDKRIRLNLKRTTQANLDALEAQLVIDEGSLRVAQENFNIVSWLPEDNSRRAQALNQVALAQQKIDNDKQQLGWLTSTASSLEVSLADAAVVVAQARVKDTEREWSRLKDGRDGQDILAAQARVDSIQALLSQTTLKSPINGVITHINSLPGDQVNSGTTSFRIDDLSRLLIDVKVAEIDVNQVKTGQPVQLSFDSIQGKSYPGKVIEISPFGTVQNGVVTFLVSIELVDTDARVKAGMTAAVDIVVNQLDQVLLVPNRAIRLQNSKRFIYILSDDQLQPVEIQIGSTSDTLTQIKSGNVKEGDLVVLNPPTTALSTITANSGK